MDRIMDSMQRRNLKAGECFNWELWSKKINLWVCTHREKIYIQGDSNMTVTDLCVNKPGQSQSYLIVPCTPVVR
jgi:hypothetical protein